MPRTISVSAISAPTSRDGFVFTSTSLNCFGFGYDEPVDPAFTCNPAPTGLRIGIRVVRHPCSNVGFVQLMTRSVPHSGPQRRGGVRAGCKQYALAGAGHRYS